jgi:hypothetical protein
MAPGRAAPDLACLAPPYRIMAMMWSNQRMGNLMENGVADMIVLGMAHIMA